MAATLQVESTLTDRYQTTVPSIFAIDDKEQMIANLAVGDPLGLYRGSLGREQRLGTVRGELCGEIAARRCGCPAA